MILKSVRPFLRQYMKNRQKHNCKKTYNNQMRRQLKLMPYITNHNKLIKNLMIKLNKLNTKRKIYL